MPDHKGPAVVRATGCPHYITRNRALAYATMYEGQPTRCIWCEIRPVVPAGRGVPRAQRHTS